MKRLYLDIGNSGCKLFGKMSSGEWDVWFRGDAGSVNSELRKRILNHADEIIACSVREDLLNRFRDEISSIPLRVIRSTAIPLEMLRYDTPETLGADRFLACYGARSLSKKSVVVIDAGSACTVDLMTDAGVYEGGVIMPGLGLIQRTVREHLPELPEPGEKLPAQWPGKSTVTSLQWGTSGAFLAALEGFVNRFRNENPTADIWLTGGDSPQLAEWLGRSMTVRQHPWLLPVGMEAYSESVDSF